MADIPEYVAKRLREAPPEDCGVVPCSIPHIGEGHVEDARVAMVGINRNGAWSRKEFSPNDQCELDDAGIRQVYERARKHFDNHGHSPYLRRLQPILNSCGAAYGGPVYAPRSGQDLAASFEVVQWATDPLWRYLKDDQQEELLDDSAPCLRAFFEHHDNLKLVLGNGRTVVRQMKCVFDMRLNRPSASLDWTTLYYGEFLGKQFIGWSTFPQRISNDRLTALADRVGELYSSGC